MEKTIFFKKIKRFLCNYRLTKTVVFFIISVFLLFTYVAIYGSEGYVLSLNDGNRETVYSYIENLDKGISITDIKTVGFDMGLGDWDLVIHYRNNTERILMWGSESYIFADYIRDNGIKGGLIGQVFLKLGMINLALFCLFFIITVARFVIKILKFVYEVIDYFYYLLHEK